MQIDHSNQNRNLQDPAVSDELHRFKKLDIDDRSIAKVYTQLAIILRLPKYHDVFSSDDALICKEAMERASAPILGEGGLQELSSHHAVVDKIFCSEKSMYEFFPELAEALRSKAKSLADRLAISGFSLQPLLADVFIHGSEIRLGEQIFWAMGGPHNEHALQTSFKLFAEKSTELLVILGDSKERGQDKFLNYLQPDSEIGEARLHCDYLDHFSDMRRDGESDAEFLHRVLDEKEWLIPWSATFTNGRKMSILHLHGMPDKGVAQDHRLAKVVLQLLKVKRAALHCSAGIGRTGVVLASLIAYKDKKDPVEVVRSLRKIRMGMVQKPHQLTAIYDVVKLLNERANEVERSSLFEVAPILVHNKNRESLLRTQC